jgi:hypothetical protein
MTRFLLILLLGVQVAFAQHSETIFTVSGVVKDAITGKPVAFAGISVAGGHIGTVTNTDGEFTLKVPGSSGYTEIYISHIGYSIASVDLKEADNTSGEFLLKPHIATIQEVTVKPADARSIVSDAIGKIEQNYPLTPHRLTGFYRETIRQRKDYVSISEAVVDIYQAPYNQGRDKDRSYIIRGRKSGNVKRSDTLLVKLQGGPHVSMLLDIVKNPDVLISREALNFYNFELVDMVMIDDESNYVISFFPRVSLSYPLYYGKLYISVGSLAFTMADFSLDLSDSEKAVREFILKKPSRLRFTPTGSRYLVRYRQTDGKYHLSYMRYELEFFADWRRKLFRTGYTIMSEMAITARGTENLTGFTKQNQLRHNTILAEKVPVYFEDGYWGDYNYIEPDQTIEAAIIKMNRRLDW